MKRSFFTDSRWAPFDIKRMQPDKKVYQKKETKFGVIISIILLSLIISFVFYTDLNLMMLILLIIGYISVLFPLLIPEIRIELYEDKLIISFPYLSFLSAYKPRIIEYTTIESVEYFLKLREPNSLIIKLKSKQEKKYWCRFKLFSDDRNNLGKQLKLVVVNNNLSK
ncbi:MAG: hypothetical protein V1779_15255 [bacterium]